MQFSNEGIYRTPKRAYTIRQFCDAYGISRAFLYELWKEGQGPKRFKVGARVLISDVAALEWQRKKEAGIN